LDAAVAGLVDYKGAYDASLNSPELLANPATLKGDMYVVTVAGTFYGEELEIGDSLIAEIDNPTTLDDWTRIQFNLDSSAFLAKDISLTGATAETAWSMEYAVNKSAGNDTGILLNKIDTNSPGVSYLIDAQVDGSSKFSVDNVGQLRLDKGLTYGNTTGIAFGDGDTLIFESVDDELIVALGDGKSFEFSATANAFQVGSNGGCAMLDQNVFATTPGFVPNQGDKDTGIGSAGADQLSLIAGGVEGMRVTEAGSFVQNTMSGGTNTDTSGTINALAITPTYNQASGTASNTDLLINRTETAVGSGEQFLAEFAVDGSTGLSFASGIGGNKGGTIGFGLSGAYRPVVTTTNADYELAIAMESTQDGWLSYAYRGFTFELTTPKMHTNSKPFTPLTHKHLEPSARSRSIRHTTKQAALPHIQTSSLTALKQQ
jgi:hypothetical protein